MKTIDEIMQIIEDIYYAKNALKDRSQALWSYKAMEEERDKKYEMLKKILLEAGFKK